MDCSLEREVEWDQTSPTLAIVEAIASLEDVDPASLSLKSDICLSEHIDLDALDRILTEDKPVSVSFGVAEYRVEIDGRGLQICTD